MKNINLKELNLKELKDICRKNKIKGYSQLNKNDLILFIKKKKMIGGDLHNWIVPSNLPNTQSWLYMPLIYRALGANVEFPAVFNILLKNYILANKFNNVPIYFKNKIKNNSDPYDVNEKFFTYFREKIKASINSNISSTANNINALQPFINGKYHIKASIQEKFIETDIFITLIIESYLIPKLIESAHGKKIILNALPQN